MNVRCPSGQQIGDQFGISEVNSNIGTVYQEQGLYSLALEKYVEALKYREEIQDISGITNSHLNIGRIHLARKQYSQADFHFQKSLQFALDAGLKKRLKEIYENLTELKAAQGQYQLALAYHQHLSAVKDSLYNDEALSRITSLQAQYENEKQAREIEQLQNKANLLELRQRFYAFALLFALLAGLLLLLFFRFRQKKNRELLAFREEQARQAEEVSRMKSRFFANISHEFRTPLTLIIGPVKDLLGMVDEAKQSRLLRHVERHATRLLRLINQLLYLSRAEAGKLELNAGPADIVPFVRGLAMAFQSLAEQREIRLDFNTFQEECFIYFDREKLEKAVTNILSNAFKFTPPNGKVSVILEKAFDRDHRRIAIRVKDTGPGISQEQQAFIFDRFYTGLPPAPSKGGGESFESTTDSNSSPSPQGRTGEGPKKRSFQPEAGTGIGLALAKELVELHQGEILVESNKGKGAMFSIILPFGKEHLAEHQLAAFQPGEEGRILAEEAVGPLVSAPEEMTSGLEVEKPVILIVEDHEELRSYIAEAIQGRYAVLEAPDGLAGLKKAREHIPDLVISDVMMPRTSGFELCKSLKEDERTSHIPIILLSARASEKDRLEGLEYLADDYLAKPFNTQELLARIQNLIIIRRKLQERFRAQLSLEPREAKVSSKDQAFLEKLLEQLEEQLDNEHFGVEQLSPCFGDEPFTIIPEAEGVDRSVTDSVFALLPAEASVFSTAAKSRECYRSSLCSRL